MKRISFFFMLCFITVTTFSQTPKGIKYQSIIRDAEGHVYVNQQVSLEMDIIQGSTNGNSVCSEIHQTETNEFGLVNLVIGSLDTIAFKTIDWSTGRYFIKVSLNGSEMGTSELLSVPFALYAERSGNQDTTIVESQWENNEQGINYNDGYVGIGTSEPQANLQIEGTSEMQSGRNFLWLKNNSTDQFSDVYLKMNSGDESYTSLHHRGDSYTYGGTWYQTTLLWNHGRGLVLRTSTQGLINFELIDEDNVLSEIARFTGSGRFGIGTTNPMRTLHIKDVMRLEPRSTPPANPAEGDIYMDSSIHKLRVYDGTTWQSCW
ncbi:MAG: hypothetical protein RBS55_11095 [Bacteroidales bacterium]|jgi:hypothetical protein|nr:hypothetical protein [Bacteroidales bacterium]